MKWLLWLLLDLLVGCGGRALEIPQPHQQCGVMGEPCCPGSCLEGVCRPATCHDAVSFCTHVTQDPQDWPQCVAVQ